MHAQLYAGCVPGATPEPLQQPAGPREGRGSLVVRVPDGDHADMAALAVAIADTLPERPEEPELDELEPADVDDELDPGLDPDR